MSRANTTDRTDQERQQDQRTAQGTAQGAAQGAAQATTPGAASAGAQPGGAQPGAQEQGGQTTRTQTDRVQSVPMSREGGRESGRGAESGGGSLARSRMPSMGMAPFGGLASPFALMQQLQGEMDRLFEDFGFGRGGLSPFAAQGTRGRGLRTGGAAGSERALWSPQLDVFRRGDELVVRADLPGLSKDDVTVDVEDGILTIRGERRQEAQEDREGYYWSERSHGTFERSIALPEGIDEERAAASFRDGVLEVTMPAPKAEAQRRRRVEIR